ncbi:MAG: DUF309 domain-containing protein [Candidatus Schekmanbacteria bacterium]|nr:DUF309 domain-containing protein [Candidatus Schekmanbacteria bacterium]
MQRRLNGAPEIADCLARGARLFNEGSYFAAHEEWEQGWLLVRGGEKRLLQGLIQVAAACFKLQQGKPTGMVRLLAKAQRHLRAADAETRLVDVGSLLEAITWWSAYGSELVRSSRTAYDPARLPRVALAAGDGGVSGPPPVDFSDRLAVATREGLPTMRPGPTRRHPECLR